MANRPSVRQMSTSAHERDTALIHKLGVEYTSALKSGDMERWIALWKSEAVEIQPAGLSLSGIKQIRAALEPLVDLFDTEMTLLPENVRLLDHWAYAYGSYKVMLTPKEGGEPISDTGMFLTILEKQADGSWKIAVTCCNNSQNL